MIDIAGKLPGFCHTLPHDGSDYGDYIEQLTYLLFLTMIKEKGLEIPTEDSGAVLREKAETEVAARLKPCGMKLPAVNCRVSSGIAPKSPRHPCRAGALGGG